MPEPTVTLDKKAGTLTIVMPLEKPNPSASGMTMVIASTRGNKRTDVLYDGQPVSIGVNAYYKPPYEPVEE